MEKMSEVLDRLKLSEREKEGAEEVVSRLI